MPAGRVDGAFFSCSGLELVHWGFWHVHRSRSTGSTAMKRCAALVVVVAVTLPSGRAQQAPEGVYARAYAGIRAMRGISGFGATTATSAIHTITIGQNAGDANPVLREVMKY